MEGNSQMINEMKTELAKSPKAKTTTDHLVIGEEYKITGGKFKKYKVCRVEKINPTYSDVKVAEDAVMLATGNVNKELVVKVKNTYLLRANPPGIEMPDMDDLNVVPDLEEYLNEHPDQMEEIVIEETIQIDPSPELDGDGFVVTPGASVSMDIHKQVLEDLRISKAKEGLTDAQKMELVKLILSF